MNMFNAGIKRHLLTLQLCTIYLYLNLKLSEAFLQEERTELFDTEHERAVSKFYRGLLSKSQILCYNELKGAASTVKYSIIKSGDVMINITTTPNQSSDCSVEITCDPQSSLWGLGWVFIPVLEVLLNSFLIFVTYRSRSTLRHNYVYAYVISVFAGNFFLGLFAIYSLLNFALIIERYWGSPNPFEVDHSSPSHRPLQLWWSFRRAFMVSLYLINNANVSALIYGIKDSAYFVGRNAMAAGRKTEKVSLRHRRNKAVFVITLAWLVPLAFSVAGLFSSCIDHCDCVYANYDDVDYCQTKCFPECSRIWQPLTDRFLLAIALTWCIEVVFIVLMLVSAVKRSMRVMKPRSDSNVGDNSNDQTESENAISTPSTTTSKHDDSQSGTEFQLSDSGNLPSLSKQARLRYFENNTVKLLSVIAATFFVTSLPMMVVIFIDVNTDESVLLRYSVTAVIAISLVYGLVVPVILVRYMSNLRSATQSWFLSLKCCTRTTVRNQDLKTVT